ncbi:AraC family transcriptional regulator [Tahibacter amnicola]|uniref:AraC family transcriptional regulator n=1 Tax=Tahibacter amnicola TaxID=2976241 RepID=A0ABY6BRI4_9GAMM|nr:AraC family transcriptional regulator [Tahibacter amnicola]UXI70377.1 AraC family transcriptional regulator [Tahibacter amnicola]
MDPVAALGDDRRVEAVPDIFESELDRAEFKRPHRRGVELYRAHIVCHAFDPHTHGAYGIGTVVEGVERFRYRGADYLAAPGSLILMNPDVLHTGRAATDTGWRYRMVYLDEATLRLITGSEPWHFAEPVARDADAAVRVNALLKGLWNSSEPLAIDSALYEVVQTLRPHARSAEPELSRRRVDAALDRPVELMQAHLDESLTLERLAAAAGLSPFHFLRRFKAHHHATPQQMLMALRLHRAKLRLGEGVAPAEVALEVGLVDQAHLTRRFVRMYGVTPARYQQQLGTRPRRSR